MNSRRRIDHFSALDRKAYRGADLMQGRIKKVAAPDECLRFGRDRGQSDVPPTPLSRRF
jgi:hypothetical protein